MRIGQRAADMPITIRKNERRPRNGGTTSSGRPGSLLVAKPRVDLFLIVARAFSVWALIFALSVAKTFWCSSHNSSIDNNSRSFLLRAMTAPNRSTVSACLVL